MQLEFIKSGRGEPLLFLGGAFTTFDYYKKFIDLLSQKYTVYFFNYPGLGKSEKLENGHSLESYIKTIDMFVRREKLKRFHLTGASFGGYLAIKYASSLGKNKIKNLILLSPATKLKTKSSLRSALELIKNNFHKHRGGRSPLTDNALQFKYAKNLRERIKQGLFATSCLIEAKDIHPELPTLIVIGELERIVDNTHTLKVFSNCKNLKVVTIPGEGHDAFALLGNKILRIISDFTSAPKPVFERL